ncbi:MAG TPA: hypothetical protein PLN33_18735 [Hyphomonadaceae bacterium]|nr:hypothetical protein [Hyphomonadaceae bacterium]HPN05325.1 hypothetical protein [Hyphomonadaceae bacterium]
MRLLLLAAVSTFALAACGDPKPAEPTPAPVPESAATEPELPAEAAAIPAQDVASKLAGTWQSTEDANSIITITADTWTNTYTGDDSVNDVAKWRAFPGTESPANAEGLTFTPTSTYLEVKSGDNTFFYELGKIEADAFDFFYVSRGNHLSYKRIA